MNPSRLNTCRGAAELCGAAAIVNRAHRSGLLPLVLLSALTEREANELLFEDTSLGTATAAERRWHAAGGAGGRVESQEPPGRLTRVPGTRRFFFLRDGILDGKRGLFLPVRPEIVDS